MTAFDVMKTGGRREDRRGRGLRPEPNGEIMSAMLNQEWAVWVRRSFLWAVGIFASACLGYAQAPPRLHLTGRETETWIEIAGEVEPDNDYRIEGSVNLKAWQEVGRFHATNFTENFLVTKTPAGSGFFRLSTGLPPLPRVWLASPTNGETCTRLTGINLVANATTTNAVVVKMEFFADDKQLGASTSAPFTLKWLPTQNKSFSLHVKATDNFGRIAYSSKNTVIVAKTIADAGSTTAGFQDDFDGTATGRRVGPHRNHPGYLHCGWRKPPRFQREWRGKPLAL